MHVDVRACVAQLLIVFSLMNNFLPFAAIISSVDFLFADFSLGAYFFSASLITAFTLAVTFFWFYRWRCVCIHMCACVVLICWLVGLCPPFHSINYFLPTFYQLNVSNKVNLCAFKYMQNANFFLSAAPKYVAAPCAEVCAMAWRMVKEVKYHTELTAALNLHYIQNGE